MSKIGVFDSGIGGLSVLNEALRQLPGHDYVYLADSANAPYGERPSEWVAQRSLKLCSWLIQEQQCEAVVVACNTATAQAITSIRELFPATPVIGVEPGIKPAAALSAKKVIGVLATQSTLSSEKFNALLQTLTLDCQVIVQSGSGLVPLIESGELDSSELQDLIRSYLQKIIASGADTLVLGCTHYPFLMPLIQKEFGHQLQVIDTSAAIIRQLSRKSNLSAISQNTSVTLYTTEDHQHLLKLARQLLLPQMHPVEFTSANVIL